MRSNEIAYAQLTGPPLAQPKCSVTEFSSLTLAEGKFMLGKFAEAHVWLGVWAQVTLAPLSLQMVPEDAAVLPVQAMVSRGLHPVPQ